MKQIAVIRQGLTLMVVTYIEKQFGADFRR